MTSPAPSAAPSSGNQRTIIPDEDEEDSLVSPAPTPTPVPDTLGRPAPPVETPSKDETIFLKQDGKVYRVKDWPTLQRWVVERRVGREDLVSQDGVRWQPVGSREDLQSFFQVVDQLEAAELAVLKEPSGTPLGTGRDTPFVDDRPAEPTVGTPTGSDDLLVDDDDDDDLLGVPTGLPPLPTEEVSAVVPKDEVGVSVEDDGEDVPEAFADEEEEEPDEAFAEPDEPNVSHEAETTFYADPEDGEEGEAEPAPEVEDDDGGLFFFPPPDDQPTQLDAFDGDVVSENDPTQKADWDTDTVKNESDLAAASTPPPPPAGLTSLTPDEPDDESQDKRGLSLFGDVDYDAPTVIEDDDDIAEEPEEDDNPIGDFTAEVEPEDSLSDPFKEFDALSTEAAPLDDSPLDDDDLEWKTRKGPPVGLLLAAALTLLVLGGGGWWYWTNMTKSGGAEGPSVQEALGEVVDAEAPEAAAPEAQPPPAEAQPGEEPATAEAPEGEATPTPEAEPEPAAPEPEPAPKVEPKPAPAAPPKAKSAPPKSSGGSTKKMVERAWGKADSGDISGATALFKQAVDASPNNADALFGYGYSLLEAGQADQGKTYLCRALQNAGSDVGLKREVNGILSGRQMSCN